MNGFFNKSLAGLTAIMTDQDRRNQNAFVSDYVADLDPRGPVELQLARTLGLDSWRLNRIKSVEENIFAWGSLVKPGIKVESENPEIAAALAHANSYLTHSGTINEISLYESRLNRDIARNMDLLMRRQATRAQRTQQTQPAAAAATEYPETAYRAAASAQAPSPSMDPRSANLNEALWGRGFCPAAGLPPGVACNNDAPGETTPSPLHQ
jgi:hypothetical protein